MGIGSQSDSPIMESIHVLVENGWLPLRRLAFLLGYAHPTTIYGRQRGPNAIPTVRVGGTLRVYADDVVHTLENVKDEDRDIAVAILTKYKQLLAEKESNHE